MKKITLEVKHSIGDEIKCDAGKLKVIGYTYVEGRGIQYILLTHTGSKFEWEYLYDFEIEMLDK
jgi:hypothetical protein